MGDSEAITDSGTSCDTARTLAAVRESAGLSRERLAARAELSPYNLDNGRSHPRRSTAVVLALALGIESEVLSPDAALDLHEAADAAERDLQARAVRKALADDRLGVVDRYAATLSGRFRSSCVQAGGGRHPDRRAGVRRAPSGTGKGVMPMESLALTITLLALLIVLIR